jgi:hypothetical protein
MAFRTKSPGADAPITHQFWKSPCQGKRLFFADHSPRLHLLKRKRVFAKKQSPEVIIMKLVQSLIVAAALAIPAVSSFAQSNQPVTRAEVKAQLVQLEKAGYQPGRNDPHYPDDIQAAEARVAAQNGASTGYGGVSDGSSASGSSASGATRSVSAADWRSMYGHP